MKLTNVIRPICERVNKIYILQTYVNKTLKTSEFEHFYFITYHKNYNDVSKCVERHYAEICQSMMDWNIVDFNYKWM